jgi:hypothetical protein
MTRFFLKVIVSPKIPTKNNRDFYPGSLLVGRAEISVILEEIMTSSIHSEFD